MEKFALIKEFEQFQPFKKMILLQDGRFAASDGNEVYIYNPKNNYNCEETINTGNNVNFFILLDNGQLVMYGNYNVSIWTFKESKYISTGEFSIIGKEIFSYHEYCNGLVSIYKNMIGFCGSKNFCIYDVESPYDLKIKLRGHKNEIIKAIQPKNKDRLITCDYTSEVIIWDLPNKLILNKYQFEKVEKPLLELTNGQIIIPCQNEFIFLNGETFNIEKRDNEKKKISKISIVGQFTNNYLIVNGYRVVELYDLRTGDVLPFDEFTYSDKIICLLILDEHTFVASDITAYIIQH